MSRPSPVQAFASGLTRPILSRHTQPDRLTASQASRRITPRLTTDLTTAHVSLTRVVLQRTAGVVCIALTSGRQRNCNTPRAMMRRATPLRRLRRSVSRCQVRPSLSLTRLLHVSAGSPVPIADPLSRRYDQQDQC